MIKRESGKERETFPVVAGIIQTGKNGNTPLRVFPFPVSVPDHLQTRVKQGEFGYGKMGKQHQSMSRSRTRGFPQESQCGNINRNTVNLLRKIAKTELLDR